MGRTRDGRWLRRRFHCQRRFDEHELIIRATAELRIRLSKKGKGHDKRKYITKPGGGSMFQLSRVPTIGRSSNGNHTPVRLDRYGRDSNRYSGVDRSHPHPGSQPMIPASVVTPTQNLHRGLRSPAAQTKGSYRAWESKMDYENIGEIIATRRLQLLDDSDNNSAVSGLDEKPKQPYKSIYYYSFPEI